MTTIVEITANDLREESLRQGIDPDRWTYVFEEGKGWHVRKGIMVVGTLLIEELAHILVDQLNKGITQ
jgi:hypothetical protein